MADGPHPDVSIVSSGHDVADARLHRVAAALRRRGLTVAVHGLGRAEDGPAGCAVTTRPRGGLVARGLRAGLLPWQARGRVLVTLDPDGALAAWPVARLRRRRLVVDVHEDYPALLADRAWARGAVGRVAQWVAGSATRAAARADLTLVADDHVPPLAARRRLVVRNLPDVAMLPEPAPFEAEPRALYVGDLRASRGLFDMLEAVAAAPAWTLDLVGPVSAADDGPVRARLAAGDLAGRVRLHGRQPPERAWQLARGAWAGLALLHDTPAFARAMPSKLYEYVATGLPVLTSALPPMERFVAETGAGVVVPPSDPAAAAAVLRAWHDDPLAHARLRERALLTRDATTNPYDAFADAVSELAAARADTARTAASRP